MTAHDICANSDHEPECEYLMVSMPTALMACARIANDSVLTTSMQIALTQKGQAALWVTNGCTSMSKPITS